MPTKRLFLLFSGLAIVVILSGCGLIKSDKMDPPQVQYTDDLDLEGQVTGDEEQQTVMTELYLMDKHGYIVPASLPLPNTESLAKQSLEYLVQDGPVTEMLPNGFSAVLPAETVIKGLDISNGVATIDFSKEFSNYKAEDEESVLQSVVWTVTQFDAIDCVKFRIEGEPISSMPVANYPLDSNLNREMGINNEDTGVADVMNTKPVTVYFMSSYENEGYYVPVTRRVPNSVETATEVIVNELVKGPLPGSYLTSSVAPDVSLLDSSINNSVATLNFNDNIYSSGEDGSKVVSNETIEAIVLSLTESGGVSEVAVEVNGAPDLVDVNGEALTSPVLRPSEINAY